MEKGKINIGLATATVLMLFISTCCLIALEPSQTNEPKLTVMMASAYGTILILLVQVILILREPNSAQNVIMVEFENEKLQILIRISVTELMKICHDTYNIKYQAAYWPILRSLLLCRGKESYRQLVTEGDALFQNEPYDQKYAAYLRFIQPDNNIEIHQIMRLTDMPSEIEAAAFVMKLQDANIQIFQSAQELTDWYHSLSLPKQKELAQPIHRFLKDGKSTLH
ncbi:hypothetical protein [uncultured Victivallis sp.]|uniref:hypothetical protein n=1 Tax=uncultured Victivallis sp. TaxID=354118 RepID=UPI002599CFDA|nr:hypothetical protein [uncultured Victivallis sp.]